MNASVLLRCLGAGLLILLGSMPARAEFKATPEETKMCELTIWSRAVRGDPNWSHVHHYCDCVRFTNRALSVMWKDKQAFTYNLNEAMDGCNYVISHSTPGFSLLPEIYLQQAIIHGMRKENALAATQYLKAMGGNPSLVRAYTGLADLMTRNKDSKNALNIITRGLQHNPESKALKRRYTELGGTLPYPAPITPAQPAAEPTVQPPAVKPAVAEEAPAPGIAAPDPAAATPTATTPPEVGSPTNPWCRFCPDVNSSPPQATPSMPGVVPKAGR